MSDLDHARQTIANGLRELMDTALESDDPSLVAHCFASLRDFRQDAATIADDVEKHLLSCMGESSLEVESLGEVKVRRRTKRTEWDHDALVTAVVDATAAEVGVESGDLHPWLAVAAIRECIGFGAGKVTALRARGIQPDEYCRETEDGYSVSLPPRSHENDLL